MAAEDTFASSSPGLSGPGVHNFSITPDDGNDLAYVTRAIYIKTGGNLHYMTLGGEEITHPFDAGWHPLRITRIYATGTTASDMLGVY